MVTGGRGAVHRSACRAMAGKRFQVPRVRNMSAPVISAHWAPGGLLCQRGQGVGGKAGPSPADFQIGYHQQRFLLRCQAAHGQPVLGRGHVAFQLMWRHKGGHQQHPVKSEAGGEFLCQPHMAAVDGIKGTAKQGDAHGRPPFRAFIEWLIRSQVYRWGKANQPPVPERCLQTGSPVTAGLLSCRSDGFYS